MAEGQTKSDSLPESQEANEGLKQNIGGLLDQAGLDRLMEPDSLFGSEQEESETPDPTHPVENEAEDGDDEEEPYHNFVDIVNDISKPPYHKNLPSAYDWLFIGIKKSGYDTLHAANPISW